MKLRIFILFLFLPLLRAQASVIDSLMTQPRDSIGLTSDSLVLHFLEESGIPISDNNKVKLLKSGREKFIDLFEAIRQAKHHVHLEYFNFRNDSIANAQQIASEKEKKRNLWMIIGGIILAILAFIGNQIFQGIRNKKNQMRMMDMQQNIADKAEAEAKRQARNAIRTQQNRIEAGAKRKVSDAVRSKGNIKINGKSKKASI